MERKTYAALTSPESVAIIGASDDGSKMSGRPQRYLRKYGYAGHVFPVNPTRDVVQGLPSFPTVTAIHAVPDLAVIVTPAHRVPDAVDDCVRAGVPAVVVIPSGFAELNEAGRALEVRLRDSLRGSGTRLIGPNCVGVVSARSALTATINTGMDQDRFCLRDGGIAFLSQSGALAAFVLNIAQTRRVGVGTMISTGNELDISFPEILTAVVRDPAVTAVVAYIEGIRNGDAFVDALAEAQSLGKPVGMLKVGRSDHGSRAVSSHTGALAGSDSVYEGVFSQFGVSRLQGVEQLVDWAQAAEVAQGHASGAKVSVVTTSGGAGIMSADYCAEFGLQIADWDDAWLARLQALLPDYLAAKNPIDMADTGGDPTRLAPVLELMGEHPGTDIVLVVIGNLEKDEDRLIDAMRRTAANTDKLVVAAWVGGSGRPLAILGESGIAAYPDPRRALQALGALSSMSSGEASRSVSGTVVPSEDRVRAAREILEGAADAGQQVLDEFDSKRLLTLYGIPVVEERTAGSIDEAVVAAAEIGYPVVVKLLAPGVVHKSELGGVLLDLSSEEQLRSSVSDMLHALPAEIEKSAGLLVQSMAAPGVELLLGLKRDATFGQALLVGSGGVYTELLKDAVVRLPTLRPGEAQRLIASLKVSRLLQGFRGDGAKDVDAAAAAVEALATLAVELGDRIQELDINPLLVHASGQGATAVDATVVLVERNGGQGS